MSRASRHWLLPLMAAVVLGVAARASAWEPVAGTRELGPRWSGPLIYRLHEKGSDDLDREVLLAELHKGMLEWTKPDCTGASARYEGLTDELPYSADAPGADNVIAWRESGWKHGPDAVAITAPSFINTGSGESPTIVAATMWLNGQYWTWVTGATRDRQVNAYSVFLHEGGHYWGLGHTPVPMSVMNDHHSQDLTGLAADDIEGICSLYPRDKNEDAGPQPGDAGTRGNDADGCVADADCAGDDERCVAGRCMQLSDPPPAMCKRADQCGVDQACKAGRCVTDDPSQHVRPIGSDCIMDSDCESGMCRLSGEASQCTGFCETDRDCHDAGSCIHKERQTGLCGPASLAIEPTSREPAGSERDAGCSAPGSPATGSMMWLLLIPWLLRRAKRAADRAR